MSKSERCDCARCVRLVEGFMDKRVEGGKTKLRWVVMRASCRSEDALQLQMYKKRDEKVIAELYAITKCTLVGTEKGRIYTKKNCSTIPYWAIILTSKSVILQEPDEKVRSEESSINQWYRVVKDKFTMENWVIHPFRGVSGHIDGSSVSLSMFITKFRLGLAGTTPPLNCCEEWDFDKIRDCKAFGNLLFVYIKNDTQSNLGALAYREIQLRMPSAPDAQRAKDLIDRLSPTKTDALNIPTPNADSLTKFTPSPNAPRKIFASPLQRLSRPLEANQDSRPLPPPPPIARTDNADGTYAYATTDDTLRPGINHYVKY